MTSSRTYLFVFFLAAWVLFFVLYAQHDRGDSDHWKHRAKAYQQSSDSLRQAVSDLSKRVAFKDSVLLQFMMTVDKNLAELNKEAKKNMAIIRASDLMQDSLIRKYCDDMKKAGYAPESCK